MADFDNIELRSEKVRNIIGKVPPEIIRTGIGNITLILLILVLGACFVTYPESIEVPANMTQADETGNYAQVFIPYRYVTKIKEGMDIKMEIEGYEASQYGYLKGSIENYENTVVTIDGNNFFTAKVKLDSDNPYLVLKNMKGTAFILLSDKRIVQHLFP